MIFPYQIKYLDKYFSANTPFIVPDEGIKNLISDGGKVIEQKTDKAQSDRKSARKRGSIHDKT